MSLLRNLRQLTYPGEFRIAAPNWPPDLLAVLERLVESLSMPKETAQEGVQVRLLADVGTGLWRLRQKMVKSGTDRPLEEMRRAYRHLESVWDALVKAGVEIRDHTGEPVPEGGIYALRVIAFQPTPGISREKVIETIRPTIYYEDQMIQMGQVIVGTPEIPSDQTPEPNPQGTENTEPEQRG